MKIPTSTVQYFIRAAREATLSTLSTYLPGYPHASWVPICSDQNGYPVFLISHLAEHTKNLQACPNASLLITEQREKNTTRLTLIGTATPFEPSKAELERFSVLLPETSRYLSLGGFHFYRFSPAALRFIAGFGQMGWLPGNTFLTDSTSFTPAETQQLLAQLQPQTKHTLLALDPYGINLKMPSSPNLRLQTPQPLTTPDCFMAWAQTALASLT